MKKNIERIEAPHRETFQREFVAANRPVIVAGAMQDWPALSTWAPEHLKKLVGSRAVQVFASEDGRFSGHFGSKAVSLPFDDFIDHAYGMKPTGLVYYMQQRPLGRFFPELVGDTRVPGLVPEEFSSRLLWIGARGATTVLHYDAQDNFLTQVSGRKHITLFPPSELWRLYPYPMLSSAPHHSQVNIDAPNRSRFSRFRPEQAIEFVLAPGEMLFLPNGWWHQVRSLDPSISVNFFWRARWQAFLSSPMLRMMPNLGRFLGKRIVQVSREEAQKLPRRIAAAVRSSFRRGA